MSYLIDFRRASQAKTIRDEHKNIKTYGVGSDISKNNWFDYFRDLISQNYLTQTEGQYPVIVLTEKSDDVLRGSVRVDLIKVKVKEEKRLSLVSDVQHEYFTDLFDELKRTRMALAKGENVPPYVVFSDATLIEMATYLPLDIAEMRKISGVGDLKLDKYGRDFLYDIRNYCKRKNLQSQIDLKSPKRERKVRTKHGAHGDDTYAVSLKMFRSGKAIDEIAAERGLALSTMETHLTRFIPTDEVKLEELVSADKIERIREAFVSLETNGGIGPVKEYLGVYNSSIVPAIEVAGE